MRFHIQSCSVFFDKIELPVVVLLIAGKFGYNFAWRLLQKPKRL